MKRLLSDKELKNIKQMMFSGDEKSFNLAKSILIQNKDNIDVDKFWENISAYPIFGSIGGVKPIELTKKLIFDLYFDFDVNYPNIFVKYTLKEQNEQYSITTYHFMLE